MLCLRYPFPSSVKLSSHFSSSYPVTSSDLAGYNSKSSHDPPPEEASLPRFVFIVSSLSRPRPFRLLFSSNSSTAFPPLLSFASTQAFSQLHPASQPASGGQRARKFWPPERFVIRSHVPPPFYIHPVRSLPFQSSFHAPSRAVCFLSVSPFHPFEPLFPSSLLFAPPPLR